MKMQYEALFKIPITFEVKVEGDNLLISDATDLLKKQAIEWLNKNYGNTFAMDFNELEYIKYTIKGKPVD